MPASPSQNTWLARLAATALLCAWFLTILPYLQKSPSPSPLSALHPRANIADLNSSISNLPFSDLSPVNLTKRAFIQCDWVAAGLAATAARNGESNPDDLDPCAKMVFKGAHLLCLMNSPADRVPQSTWADPTLDITDYGWDHIDTGRKFDAHGLQSAYTALAINDDADHRKESYMEHEENSQPDPDGPEYEATTAEYAYSFNPLDGSMVATYSFSPDFMSGHIIGFQGPMVPLKRWSDLTFLAWRALFPSGTDGVKGLQHVFRHNIHSEESLSGMRSVLERNVADPEPFPGKWPGFDFGVDSPQGLAMLTLPNTVGVVWLLAQHKVEFGIRVIDRVHIFSCPEKLQDGREKDRWCLYLHIVDGPIGPGL